MRLAVITNILAPYRIPLFEELARRCDLRVLLLADRHANRDWSPGQVGFATETLPGIRLPGVSVDPVHINVGAWAALRRFSPEVVLGGGFTAAHLSALAWCRAHRRRFIGWGELFLRLESESSLLRRCIRHVAVRASHGWIASSSDSRDAFTHYGADGARVMVSLMPVRNALFRRLAEEARAAGTDMQLRRRYGAPLIFGVGRLVGEKGWGELLVACAALAREFPDAALVIAGDGPDKSRFESQARALQLQNAHFIGACDTPAIAALYAAADVFAFPTHCDSYGAVLGEAIACGALCVASIHAGATRDLIVDGSSGFTADPLQPGQLASALRRALNLPPDERATLAARAAHRTPVDDAAAGAIDILSYARELVDGGAWSSGRATQDL